MGWQKRAWRHGGVTTFPLAQLLQWVNRSQQFMSSSYRSRMVKLDRRVRSTSVASCLGVISTCQNSPGKDTTRCCISKAWSVFRIGHVLVWLGFLKCHWWILEVAVPSCVPWQGSRRVQISNWWLWSMERWSTRDLWEERCAGVTRFGWKWKASKTYGPTVRSGQVGGFGQVIAPYVPQYILRSLVQVKLNGIRVELAEIEASLSVVCKETSLLYCSAIPSSLRTFPTRWFGVFSFVLWHSCGIFWLLYLTLLYLTFWSLYITSSGPLFFPTWSRAGNKKIKKLLSPESSSQRRLRPLRQKHLKKEPKPKWNLTARRKEKWTKQQWQPWQKQQLPERASSTQKGHERTISTGPNQPACAATVKNGLALVLPLIDI